MTSDMGLATKIEKTLKNGKGIAEDREIQRVSLYLDLVMKWGAKINISGYRDKEALLSEYVADTLRMIKYLKGYTLVDIGSGAGVPGLVLGITCPGLRVILTEKRLKRISFLKRAVAELELGHRIRVINADKEAITQTQDMATLRAVTDLKGSLELGRQMVKAGGRVILPRGPEDYYAALEMGLSVEEYPHGGKGQKRLIAIYDK